MSAVNSPASAMSQRSRVYGLDETTLADIVSASPDIEQFRSHCLSTPALYMGPLATLSSSSSSTGGVRVSPGASPEQVRAASSGAASASYHPSSSVSSGRDARRPSTISPGCPAQSLSSDGSRPSHASARQNHLSPSGEYAIETGLNEMSERTTPNFEEDYLFKYVLDPMPNFDDADLVRTPPATTQATRADLIDPLSASTNNTGLSLDSTSTQRPRESTRAPSSLLNPENTNASNPSSAQDHRETRGDHDVASSVRIEDELAYPAVDLVANETPGMDSYVTSSHGQINSRHPGHLVIPPSGLEDPIDRWESPHRPSPRHLSPPVGAGYGFGKYELPIQEIPTRLPATSRAPDGSWLPNTSTGQSGVNPHQRNEMNQEEVPCLKDLERQRQLEEKNTDVELWIVGSATPIAAGDRAGRSPSTTPRLSPSSSMRRRRANTTGATAAPSLDPLPFNVRDFAGLDDSGIPGPGVLVREVSDDGSDDDDDDAASDIDHLDDAPSASRRGHPTNPDPLTDHPVTSGPAENEPGPRGLPFAHPWKDPPSTGRGSNTRFQPFTSNAAITQFYQCAENLETASRMATWGTRRLSDTDVEKFVGHPTLLKRLSLGRDKDSKDKEREKEKHHKSRSALFEMRRLLSRSAVVSTLKRKGSDKSPSEHEDDAVDKNPSDILSGRVVSRSTSASSKAHPGTAMGVAVAGQIAALAGGSLSPKATAGPPSTWEHAMSVIRGSRSKSDGGRKSDSNYPNSNHLSNLMLQHGGPPVPSLHTLSPRQVEETQPEMMAVPVRPGDADDDDRDDEDETMEVEGVSMDFRIRSSPTVPTLEGFRQHVQELNPRQVTFLVDRVSQEQVRRFNKLVELRSKHQAAVARGKCRSGPFCFELGGQAALLPVRASGRESGAATTAFQIVGAPSPASENGTEPKREGAVAMAHFPPGVPRPPVGRLPAEFECPLCFTAKKFQKPSDWTKHVHEDIQPFTCTFPHCAGPKSFKRKADWVRHENELHRHLEWWTCNLPECSHTCFRRDNFVQHLVREHKKPEPKVKMGKAASGSPASGQGTRSSTVRDVSPAEKDQVSRLVEECRHEATKLPAVEPCKFCGNVCSSWKQLTVHLARHLEQISLPVIDLVERQFGGEQKTTTTTGEVLPKRQGPPMPSSTLTSTESLSSVVPTSEIKLEPIDKSLPVSNRSMGSPNVAAMFGLPIRSTSGGTRSYPGVGGYPPAYQARQSDVPHVFPPFNLGRFARPTPTQLARYPISSAGYGSSAVDGQMFPAPTAPSNTAPPLQPSQPYDSPWLHPSFGNTTITPPLMTGYPDVNLEPVLPATAPVTVPPYFSRYQQSTHQQNLYDGLGLSFEPQIPRPVSVSYPQDSTSNAGQAAYLGQPMEYPYPPP